MARAATRATGADGEHPVEMEHDHRLRHGPVVDQVPGVPSSAQMNRNDQVV
jgi:hypothetical protein